MIWLKVDCQSPCPFMTYGSWLLKTLLSDNICSRATARRSDISSQATLSTSRRWCWIPETSQPNHISRPTIGGSQTDAFSIQGLL